MVNDAEYLRRLEIVNIWKNRLEPYVDGLILLGAMAYAPKENIPYSSRTILLGITDFKNLANLNEVAGIDLSEDKSPNYLRDKFSNPDISNVCFSEGLLQLAKAKKVNVCRFNIKSFNDISLRFWDYSAFESVISASPEEQTFKYAKNFRKVKTHRNPKGFSGFHKLFECSYKNYSFLSEYLDNPNDSPSECSLGFSNTLPVMLETEDDIYTCVQLDNLLIYPKVLLDKGCQLNERLDRLWNNLGNEYRRKFGKYTEERKLMNALPNVITNRLSEEKKELLEKRLLWESTFKWSGNIKVHEELNLENEILKAKNNW